MIYHFVLHFSLSFLQRSKICDVCSALDFWTARHQMWSAQQPGGHCSSIFNIYTRVYKHKLIHSRPLTWPEVSPNRLQTNAWINLNKYEYHLHRRWSCLPSMHWERSDLIAPESFVQNKLSLSFILNKINFVETIIRHQSPFNAPSKLSGEIKDRY